MSGDYYTPSSKPFIDGLSPPVGLGVDCSTMEIPESEVLGYLPLDHQYSSYSSGSAISMPSGPYSSEPLSYAPYSATWQPPGDQYESPLISERSSSGNSASSNGSSQCFDMELSSTEDLPYYVGAEQTVMRPNSNMNYELSDLRLPHPVTSSATGQEVSERFFCTEGCSNRRSFGRSYDLKRHIDEQHRCPHHNCKGLKFATAQEKADHRGEHGVSGLGFRCGACELAGHYPKSLTRAEKLKKHFKKVHGILEDLDLTDLQCIFEPCFVGKSCGGLFFLSSADLKEHIGQAHPSTITLPLEPDRVRVDSGHSSPFAEDFSTPPPAKRRLDRSPATDSKRGKLESTGLNQCLPTNSNVIPVALGVASSDQQTPIGHSRQNSPQNIRDTASTPLNMKSAPATPQQLSELVETFVLSIVELQLLTKQHNLDSVIANLEALNISSTFDCKEVAVHLRGCCPPDSMEKGKLMLSKLIEKAKLSPFRKHDPDTPPPARAKPSVQQVAVHPQPAMIALHPDEDAEVLKTWHHYLLPRFPKIAREASIKGSYSVGLVGQSSKDGKNVIIRFRSAGNQGSTSRQIIREEIKKVCEQNHRNPLNIHFSQGTAVRLVGGSSTQIALDDPSIDQEFPYQRRPWKRPGMGASIGLKQCPDMSATLGGYVLLNGVLYMLSVDHFISECRCGEKSSTLRSPSVCDVEDVREQLKKKLDDIHLKVSRLGYREVPLHRTGRVVFSGKINEELELYKRFERDLQDNEDAPTIGEVRHRCGDGEHPLRPPVNPTVDGELRRMDWSLTEITKRDRAGQNTHRHRRGAGPTLIDLRGEVNNPRGAGTPCKETGKVVGGEGAHYVGTASGYREGTINAAVQLHIDDDENTSYEWGMVVSGSERLPDTEFKGDSGAWIIGNDSKLLGLLWGWDNGLLLFTPIQDVFADIKRTVRDCHQIQLFEESDRSRRSSTLLCRPQAALSIEKTLEKQGTTIGPAATTPQILLSPNFDDRNGLERTSSTSSLVSLPSLASSSSSFSLYEDATVKSTLAEQGSLSDAKSGQWLAPPKMFQPRDLDDYGWNMIRQEEALSEDEHTPWESDLQIRCKPRTTWS